MSLDKLTYREKQIAELIVNGVPYKGIAIHLSISTHTVKSHVSNIYTKLKINGRVQLVKIFYKQKG